MKTILFCTSLVFFAVSSACAVEDTPTYEACFKMMETALKAQTVTMQAEVDALSNPQNVPVTVPNAQNDAAQKRILEGVTLKIDPENPMATPTVELEHYPLDEDEDEEAAEEETPPVITPKALCKTLYGIAID